MEELAAYNRILTDQTLLETIRHGTEDYHFHYYYENLESFPSNCVDWHWHPELEIIYAERGTPTICVDTDEFALPEGSAVLINSRMIHRCFSKGEAIIPNMVFLPSFLSGEETLIYRKFILPVLSSSIKYQIYRPEISWQKEAIDQILAVFEAQSDPTQAELATKELLLKFWRTLFRYTDFSENDAEKKSDRMQQEKLQRMLSLIHVHYYEELPLDSIAQAAGISKSSALNLFKEHLHTTPVNYLIAYRLRQAALLLSQTDKSVQTIAKEIGFENTGYFCRKFKADHNMTPSEYRLLRRQ